LEVFVYRHSVISRDGLRIQLRTTINSQSVALLERVFARLSNSPEVKSLAARSLNVSLRTDDPGGHIRK